jgi:hypothetical protein
MLGELTLGLRVLSRLCEPATHNSDPLLAQLIVGIAKTVIDGPTTYAFNAYYANNTFAAKLSASQKLK